MRKALLSFIVVIIMQYEYAQTVNHWETAIYSYDIWKYKVPTSNLPSNWNTLGFNDSSWPSGKGGFGYGDGDDSTVTSYCWSVYTRKTFTITNKSKLVAAILNIDYDDAFVAYINGVEVARSNIGTIGVQPNYNTAAASSHEAVMYSGGYPDTYTISFSNLQSILNNGTNVLSVSYHNSSNTSSDLSGITYLTFGISDNSNFYSPTPSWFTPPAQLDSFNLPIVKINTHGQTISANTNIVADMSIINNLSGVNHYTDTPNDYNGKIGINIHGSSSAMFPKLSYKVETQNALGNKNDTIVLGFPKDNDWLLYAPYSEKSLLQNVLAYRIANETGHYASRTKFVELFLDSVYKGVYIWEEKIKRNTNRVKIAKITTADTIGDQLTGGYILKIDKMTGTSYVGWYSAYTSIPNSHQIMFQYHDPAYTDLLPIQRNYIHQYVDSFETVLSGVNFADPLIGYRHYANENSFIDYLILNEISKNVDGYRLSTYMYKDKNSKNRLLNMGPAWDYNLAFGNANYCDGGNTVNWAYDFNTTCPSDGFSIPFWWNRMLQDTIFKNNLKCRWTYLRQHQLSDTYLINMIDSCVNVLGYSIQQNFSVWTILNTYVWPNNYVGGSYANEINYLKNWIITRAHWIDNNLPGNCITTDVGALNNSPSATVVAKIFPNPAISFISFEFEKESNYMIAIKTIEGKNIYQTILNNNEIQLLIDINTLNEGVYLAEIHDTKNQTTQVIKFVKI